MKQSKTLTKAEHSGIIKKKHQIMKGYFYKCFWLLILGLRNSLLIGLGQDQQHYPDVLAGGWSVAVAVAV